MRAFVRLRQIVITNRDITLRLNALEKKYEGRFKKVFDAILRLMTPPLSLHRAIGFTPSDRS